MYSFVLLIVTIALTIQTINSASVSSSDFGLDENIKSNLVADDVVEVFTPPKPNAKNYFILESAKTILESENPYVVEIYSKHLTIKTTGISPQKIKLNQTETEGVRKLALSFVELLNSSKLSLPSTKDKTTTSLSNLKPLIILANSGISLEFLNISDTEVNATVVSLEEKRIIWSFLTKFARNVFEEKLKQLKLNETYAEIFDSPVNSENSFAFQNFIDFIWTVMKISVSYAETVFGDWTTPQPKTTAAGADHKYSRSSTVTLFAFEEPSPFHEFPAEESQYRRKDIDSIFYGRGVI